MLGSHPRPELIDQPHPVHHGFRPNFPAINGIKVLCDSNPSYTECVPS